MKKLSALLISLLLATTLIAQVPQKISYQAVIRNSNNVLASNQSVRMRISILQGSVSGTTVYVETHTGPTNVNGVVSVEIGGGTVVTGTFAGIDWSAGPSFIKSETDPTGGTNYTLTATTQLLSVPYALVAGEVSGPFTRLEVAGTTSDMEEALFEVKNKNGQTVFAVYNEGVRIYVEDGSKGSKGGFAVGGFSKSKQSPQDLLFVSPDSIRAYVDSDASGKGAKGGFAVGTFSAGKSVSQDLLVISPDSIRAYVGSDDGKASKGGFAIGSFSTSKSPSVNLLLINPDSTRFYLPEGDAKGKKGGFAISSYGDSKSIADNFFFLNQDSSRFYIRKSDANTSSTFDIIGFDENKVRKSLLSANADTVGIKGVLNIQNNMIVDGNINLGGDVKPLAKPAVDADGYTYKTVVIGEQVWMAENLRTTKYRNGDPIGTTTLPGDTITYDFNPKYQWPYQGIETNAAVYGRLYTWYAATDSRKICPTGFHLPTYNELDFLIMYLMHNGYGYEGQGYAIAKSMASVAGWNPYVMPGAVGDNPAENNLSGFNGMPAGLRDTFNNNFIDLGNSANWWGFDESEDQASYLYLNYSSSEAYTQFVQKSMGLSIRCIQD